jgi:outer membrane protein TolC
LRRLSRAIAKETRVSTMTLQTSPLRIVALLASTALLSVTASAQTSPNEDGARPDMGEPSAGSAPIEKFDLSEALMAPQGGLTSDEAAKRAVARAPQILGARATADVSQADVDAGWTTFIPVIDLAAQYKRVNLVPNNFSIPGAPATPNTPVFQQPVHQYALTAGAQWAISDVFLRAWPAYKANVGIAESQKTQIEVSNEVVALSARNAYYEYARALAAHAVAEQAVKQAEAQAKQIKLFVDAGTAAQVDYMTASARLAEARSAMATAAGRVAVSRNSLGTLTGQPNDEIRGLSEPVLEAPKGPQKPAEDLLRHALENRAEMRALRKMVRANEYAQKAQRGSQFPQFVVSASDYYGQPNPRWFTKPRTFKNTWELGAALTYRPNNTATGYYATQKAGAQLRKVEADLLAQQDAIRVDVITAYEDFKSAQAVTEASQARLSAAEEAYRVRLATYRVGAGVIVDLLDADLTVSQARLQMANAAINTRAALAQLRRAAALDR